MKAHQILSRDEIQRLTTASDLRGALSILVTWGIIAASLAGVAVYPSVLSIVAALVLLGGRQLALAVLAHECAHRSLFRSPRLNRVIGKWLCGAPVWVDVERYRVEHIRHHAYAGTPSDPDAGLASGFPVSSASLLRKALRDLVGLSGVKRVAGLFLMDIGRLSYTQSDKIERAEDDPGSVARYLRRFIVYTGPFVVTNLALLTIMMSVGAGWAYLVWAGAYMTTYSLFVRIRSMAEHACTEANPDPTRHTRTTLASPLERLTVAPHHVNYHTEHHLLPTAPHYRLPEMHALLKARGAFDEGHLAPSYRAVLVQMGL